MHSTSRRQRQWQHQSSIHHHSTNLWSSMPMTFNTSRRFCSKNVVTPRLAVTTVLCVWIILNSFSTDTITKTEVHGWICTSVTPSSSSKNNQLRTIVRHHPKQNKKPRSIVNNICSQRRGTSSIISNSGTTCLLISNVDVVNEDNSSTDNDSISSGKENIESSTSSDTVQDAVAKLTTDTCELLGVKCLGIDYGLVRTGIATSVGYDPVPVTILTHLNTTEVCEQILKCVSTYSINRIVLGYPTYKDGSVVEQTIRTIEFGVELTRMVLCHFGTAVPVYFYDERYTSKEAEARANPTSDKRLRVYGTLDAEAACIILETYYNENGEGGHFVPLVNRTVEFEDAEDYMEETSRIRDECLDEYAQRQRNTIQERQQRVLDRERIQQERKDRIAQDMQIRKEQQNDDSIAKRKKKKKKKRKK